MHVSVRNAPFIVIVLIGLVVATACGGSPKTPIEILADSRERFAEVEVLLVKSSLSVQKDSSQYSTGEAGFRENELVYDTGSFPGSYLYPNEIAKTLVLPPDYYFATYSGDWFVERDYDPFAEEPGSPFIDDPVKDYRRLTTRLTGLEQRTNKVIDGETFLRFAGVVNPNHFWLGGGYEDETELVVLVAEDGYLPEKIIVGPIQGGDTLSTVTFSFEYPKEVEAPERPQDVKPGLELPVYEPPCIRSKLEECLETQTDLIANSSLSCSGSGGRICLAPFGQISPALAEQFEEYYMEQYGLEVIVSTPNPIPADLITVGRNQPGADAIIDHAAGLFPAAYQDPDAILVALVPVDVYMEISDWTYVFGMRRTGPNPSAVISTLRMRPEAWGQRPDDAVMFSRARKLLTKYIGLMHFGLLPNSSPTSPMYDVIRGPSDLDRMEEPLELDTTLGASSGSH